MNLDFLNLRSRNPIRSARVGRSSNRNFHHSLRLPAAGTPARCKEDLRADGALGLFGPTISSTSANDYRSDDIAQQRRRRINIIDSHIDVPTIEEIPECAPRPVMTYGQTGCGGWWHFFEIWTRQGSGKAAAARPGRSPNPAVYFRVHMTVDDKDVQQAIIVKVEEPVPQARKGLSAPPNPSDT